MSWEELTQILDEQRRELARPDPPPACPNDGQPLERDAKGRLHCRFDGWTEGER